MSIISISGSSLKSFCGAGEPVSPFAPFAPLVPGRGITAEDGVVGVLLPLVGVVPLAVLGACAPALPSGVDSDPRYSLLAISICVLLIKSDMADTRRRISVKETRLLALPLARDPALLLWWPAPLAPDLPCPLSGTSLDRDRVIEFCSSRRSRSLVY